MAEYHYDKLPLRNLRIRRYARRFAVPVGTVSWTYNAPPDYLYMLNPSTKDVALNTDIFPITEGPMDVVDPQLAPSPPSMQQSRRQGDAHDAIRQKTRIKRLLIVGLFAVLYLAVLAVLYLENMMRGGTLAATAVTLMLTLLGLYGFFASGLNKKAQDKNLTAPIALCAITIMLVNVYAAPASRMVYGPFVFIVVAYGMFRLPQKTMLLLSAAAIIGYAAVISMLYLGGIQPTVIRLALLEWLVLAVTLPGFVLLASRVRRLHSALYKAGLRIKNIEEHARRDQLLGCYNRRYMIAMLEEQKRLADENGQPFCLAVIDLDHFKNVNDEVGHLAGDEVLRSFARIAQENVRQEDVFGRYGGEEFLLVLPQTPLLAALNTAERIREQVECHEWQARLQRPVTVSIGLTQYTSGESVLDLFARTDTAMYLAKRGGRNQVVVEEPSVELWSPSEL